MEIIRFGELYSIPTSNGVSRPSAVRGEGFHMINMGELFSFDVINEMPMERVFLSDKEQKKYLVKKGDLLFARQSLVAAGAGKCSIVNNILEPTTFESHLIRVRLDETRCCPRYYYYLFKLPDNPIKTIVNQCAQAGIRGSELQKIKVPLPILAEQHRIASILSAYDNLIENNNKRIRLLEQMAENLYKEWFVRFRFPGHEKAEFENGLPKGWSEEVASDVIDVMSGGTPKTEREDFYGGEIPFYTPKDADDSIFVYSTITSITKEGLTHCNSQLYPVNTLMITARGTVGKLSLLAVPMAMNQSCFALSFKDRNNPYYLYYSIKKEVSKLKKMANGGVFDTIIVKTFDHLKVVLPNNELLGVFEKKVSTILGQIKYLQRQNSLLSRQRDLLLPRLMSGKLEV